MPKLYKKVQDMRIKTMIFQYAYPKNERERHLYIEVPLDTSANPPEAYVEIDGKVLLIQLIEE